MTTPTDAEMLDYLQSRLHGVHFAYPVENNEGERGTIVALIFDWGGSPVSSSIRTTITAAMANERDFQKIVRLDNRRGGVPSMGASV